jgi:carbon-monoxide dehydrogenase large subunit
MLAAAHAREHHYRLAAAFSADGTLLGLGGRITCNIGAYSVYPWTAGIEPLMAGGLLAGPYRCPVYDCEVLGVATNTAPAGPYRGVARPASTFAMERMLDVGARQLGLDPVEIRRRNLVTAADLPYEAATRLVHDSPTYDIAFEAVVEAIDWRGHGERQRSARRQGRRIGVGFAVYNELTGLGKKASAGPRTPFRTGHEGMTIRIDPSGTVTVLAGVTGQGQGLETTMAQIVADELGVAYDEVRVLTGDTDRSLFGFGAFSSRQGVIGGGAAVTTARKLRDKVVLIAAHLLEANVDDLVVADGQVFVRGSAARGVPIRRIAQIAYLEPQELPPGVEPGLEATAFFDPEVGTFAAGALAVEVEVDADTGRVDLRRVVCAEDAGMRLHPVIVEGQVHGALAQGIANALFEHVRYGPDGQLQTSNLMDYLVPSAAELPSFETIHVDEPSATNPLGVRGVGEGGTLGPPAAIANAVADALRDLGVETNELPLSPEAVHRLIIGGGRPG